MARVYDRNKGKEDLPPLWYLDYQLSVELADKYRQGERRVREPAGTQSEAKASLVLARRQQEVLAGTWKPLAEPIPPTFGWCSEQRIARARELGVKTVADIETRLKLYWYERFGQRLVQTITPPEIEKLVLDLVNEGRLAPRSIHHVYSAGRGVFEWALAQDPPAGGLKVNPCRLKTRRRKSGEGILPKKKDKDPRWRRDAKWAVWEIEVMLGAPLSIVPLDRKVFYCTMLLTGSRVGEICGLLVKDVDRAARPLPRLYITEQDVGEGLKGDGAPREVPLHPLLWELVEVWLDFGFMAIYGRPPTPDDYLIPSRLMKRRSINHMLKKLKKDLQRLQLPERTNHDARRGFISLMAHFGASEPVVRAMTHEGMATDTAEVFRNYQIHEWGTMCQEMLKVQLTKRATPNPKGLALPKYALSEDQREAMKDVELAMAQRRLARGARTATTGEALSLAPTTELRHRVWHSAHLADQKPLETRGMDSGVDGTRIPTPSAESLAFITQEGNKRELQLAAARDIWNPGVPDGTAVVPTLFAPSVAADLREAGDAIRSGRVAHMTAEWRMRLAAACDAAAEALAGGDAIDAVVDEVHRTVALTRSR